MKKRIRYLMLALITMAPTLYNTAAHSEKKARVTKRTRKTANRHFKNGVRLYDQNKYDEALAEFERAYSLSPHPLVLFNLAATYRELSQYDKAVHYFNRFLDEGPGEVPKERLEQATNDLEDILKLVASLVIKTEIDGATIEIDDRTIGVTPLESPAIVGPGDHVIEAHLDEKRSKRELRVAAGDTLVVDMGTLSAPQSTSSSPATAFKPDAPKEVNKKSPKRIHLSGFFGFTIDEFGDRGAPGLGVGYALHPKFVLGVDATFVAYSVIPNVRFGLAGDELSVHAVFAAPISFSDDSTDYSVAGGLGVRYSMSPAFWIRAEGMVSYTTSFSYPVFLAAELRF